MRYRNPFAPLELLGALMYSVKGGTARSGLSPGRRYRSHAPSALRRGQRRLTYRYNMQVPRRQKGLRYQSFLAHIQFVVSILLIQSLVWHHDFHHVIALISFVCQLCTTTQIQPQACEECFRSD